MNFIERTEPNQIDNKVAAISPSGEAVRIAKIVGTSAESHLIAKEYMEASSFETAKYLYKEDVGECVYVYAEA